MCVHSAPLQARAVMRAALRRAGRLRLPLRASRCGLAAAAPGSAAPPPFAYTELFQAATPKETPWRKLTGAGVSTLDVGGQRVLRVEPEALRLLAAEAMTDISHLLRPGHLQQLANILKDPEAREGGRARVRKCSLSSAPGLRQRPVCGAGAAEERQRGGWHGAARLSGHGRGVGVEARRVRRPEAPPGTAIVQGKRGQYVWTDGNDEEALSRGVYDTARRRMRAQPRSWPAHLPRST